MLSSTQTNLEKSQIQKIHFETIELFNTLNSLTNINADKTYSDEWATGHGLNQALEKWLGDSAHIIHPDNSSVFSLASGDPNKALEGSINYAKMISGYSTEDETITNGFIHKDDGILTKPIAMILNTGTAQAKSSTDTSAIGGTHWQCCVILPKHYKPLYADPLDNKNEIIFYLDSLHPSIPIPKQFYSILTQGRSNHEFQTEEGKEYTHSVPASFPNAEVIDRLVLNQQKGWSDCGWWALYNALMLVFTGRTDYLRQFKQASREPAYKLRSLFPNLSHQIDVDGQKQDQELHQVKIIEIQQITKSYEKTSDDFKTSTSTSAMPDNTLVKSSKDNKEIKTETDNLKKNDYQINCQINHDEQTTVLLSQKSNESLQNSRAQNSKISIYEVLNDSLPAQILNKTRINLEVNETHTFDVSAKLKEKYQSNNYLTRIMSAEQYSLTESYINLVIVEQDETKKKENDLDKANDYRDERLSSYESLHQVSKPIDIEKIFDAELGEKVKKVIIYGRAGIGKSTMCKYMAAQWQDEALWKDKFESVLWVPLRELVHNKPTSVAQVIMNCCIGGIKKPNLKEVNQYLLNTSKLLFILDGYDEIAQAIEQQEHQNLRKIIKGILTEDSYHVILTSRLMSIQQIDSDIITFDKRLENVGFTNENIKSYANKFYPNKSEKLIKFLNSNKGVWGIAHIPINLDLICSIWETSDRKKSDYTMTDLYNSITDKLLEKYLVSNKICQSLHKEEKQLILMVLEEIALEGMLTSQIIIPSKKVKEVIEKVETNSNKVLIFDRILKSGLIKTIGSNREERDNDVYFLHLTFQEYMAARYLARSFEDIGSQKYKEAKELVAQHKYTSQYEVMWWFVAGTLYDKGKKNNSYLGLTRFFNELESHPRTLLELSHINLMIKCIDECKADKNVPGINELASKALYWVKYGIYGLKWNIVVKNLLISPYFVKSSKVKEVFYNALNNQSQYVRGLVTETLGSIGNEATVPTLINILNNDRSGYVIRVAAKALSNIGREVAISALITALNYNQNLDVRTSAAEALGKIGNKDTVPALITALNSDLDENVRRSAAGALGNISNKDAIPALITALNSDKNKYVRNVAAEALGKIGNKDAVPALITALNSDLDENIRCSAAEALGKIGNKDAVPALITALNSDKDKYVRNVAAWALDKIGNKDAIPALITALNSDKNKYVKIVAAGALGNIGNEDAIQALIIALNNDKNRLVRHLAARILSNIGGEVAIQALRAALNNQDQNNRSLAAMILAKTDIEVPIQSLITVLNNDSDGFIRESAAKALGNIGNKVAVSALVAALDGDQNELVRCSAAEALGNMGGKVAIQALIKALDDKVRSISSIAGHILRKLITVNNDEAIESFSTFCNNDEKLIADIRVALSTSIIIKCFEISNNSTWLSDGLLLSDAVILLDKERNIITVKESQLSHEIQFTEEQVITLLNILKNQATEKNLSTDVYDYYLGIGKLGLRGEDLGVKELTPLHLAAENGNFDKVKAILEKDKSDLDNQHNELEDTPLLLAVKAKHIEVVKYLVEQKADVTCTNLNGEDAAEQALKLFKDDKPILDLLFKNFYVHDQRIQYLLERAALNYIGLNNEPMLGLDNDPALIRTVSLIAGKENTVSITNNTDNLLTTYKMYLDNATSITLEHQDVIEVDGLSPLKVLSVRLFFYVGLYLKLQKGSVDLPLTEEGESMSTKSALEKLQREIMIISNTIASTRLNLACFMDDTKLLKALCLVRAEGVVERLKDIRIIGYECHLQTGYGGHCIYVGLTKIDENKVIARVDNRWVDGTWYGMYKDNGYIKEGNRIRPDNIKSYCVGVFELESCDQLKAYISDIIYAFCNRTGSKSDALNLIYGSSLPSKITQISDDIKIQVSKWPYHNIQSDGDNCTLSSHNLGILVRCGNSFFEWLRKYELRCVPSLSNITANVEVDTKVVENNGNPKLGLMKKLAEAMKISLPKVYIGKAVEKALVSRTEIATSQQSSNFNIGKAPNEVIFNLQFLNNKELGIFTDYYEENFAGSILSSSACSPLAISAGESKVLRTATIVMDTEILLNKIAPTLGEYHNLKNIQK